MKYFFIVVMVTSGKCTINKIAVNLNDFSIKYSKDLPQIFSNQSCECWIEDDCLMIKWNLLKDKDPEEIRSIFE